MIHYFCVITGYNEGENGETEPEREGKDSEKQHLAAHTVFGGNQVDPHRNISSPARPLPRPVNRYHVGWQSLYLLDTL